MASNTAPKALGKLEFLDIKTSLVDYLRSQSVFSGYAFQGSALSTLMDLMAYNAYYYALYSNMIVSESFLDSAQRIQSLISLTKPLGYTIPSKTSAKIKIAVGAVPDGTNTIPKYSIFYGKNSEGTQYKFYNLEDIPVADSQTDFFTIYEGKNLIDIEVADLIDIYRQRVSISDFDMDIDTLQVTVRNPTTNVDEVWTRIDNTGYSNTLEQKIYFVERTETGFMIQFGLYNSVGKDITEEVRSVRVRYVKTSGIFGNNISLFNSAVGTVFTENEAVTSGGREEPSIDEIKFLAPKWFAAQERAVTVNDYKALVLEAGFFGSASEFNIYGGEEIVPQRYGRVFVTSQRQLSQVNDLMDFIKQRSVLTVLPEYVTSVPISVFVDFTFSYSDGLARSNLANQETIRAIKSIFNEKYGSARTFNLNFDANDFCVDVRAQLRDISISPDNFNIYVEQLVDTTNTDYTFNLQNEIALEPRLILSRPFKSTLSPSNVVYYAEDFNIVPEEPIQLLSEDLTQKISPNVGKINPQTGVVSFKSKIMTDPVIIKIPFKRKNIRIGLNNLSSFTIKNITVT